jgi:3-hydroxyisobutyrate dehydrogenase-like beta-hydroxyacid dehydrogenase
MALNILKAGHQLTVFDRRPEATAELERRGARRAGDLVALGREVRATLLSLPDERVVEAVVFGERPGGGLIDGAHPGDVVIDLSTVSPGSTRRLAARMAERGVTLIDAPVSGSVGGARAGTLAVMIGASEDTARPFAPVLSAIGSSLFYLGETGRGNVLKLLNNLTALTNQAVLCQALALGDRLGIPRQVVGEVLGKSSGASFILERKLAAIVKHDYAAGFFIDLARKDLGLALDLAREAGARLDVADVAQRLYDEASGKGLGRLDSSGLLALFEPTPRT